LSAEELNLSMPYAPCWKKLLDLEIQKIIDLETPKSIVSVVAVNATANTNIVAVDPTKTTPLTAKKPPCIWRIYIVLATSGVFSVIRQVGGTTNTELMNQGTALTAGAGYMFDILVDQGEKIDFQTSVTGVVSKLSVVEKDDAK
jgi:hypothetical protein